MPYIPSRRIQRLSDERDEQKFRLSQKYRELEQSYVFSPAFLELAKEVASKDGYVKLEYIKGEPVVSGHRGSRVVPVKDYLAVAEQFGGSEGARISDITVRLASDGSPGMIIYWGEMKNVLFGCERGGNWGTVETIDDSAEERLVKPSVFQKGGIHINYGNVVDRS